MDKMDFKKYDPVIDRYLEKRRERGRPVALHRNQIYMIIELTKRNLFRPQISRKLNEWHERTGLGCTCGKTNVYYWQRRLDLI